MAAEAMEGVYAPSNAAALADLSDASIFHRNQHWPIFARLRQDDPVHHCTTSQFGPYWSITRYKDIMEVDSNHQVFSSANATSLDETRARGINPDSTRVGGFLGMDSPQHDEQRKIVSSVLSPSNLTNFEHLIRQRTKTVLSGLPIGEGLDWVQRDHAGFVGDREEFWAFAHDLHGTFHHVTQHYIGNHIAEIEGETAHAETYFIFVAVNNEGQPFTMLGGRYVDRLEKRDGKWAILHRIALGEWAAPSINTVEGAATAEGGPNRRYLKPYSLDVIKG